MSSYQDIIKDHDLDNLTKRLDKEDDSFDINAPNKCIKNKTLLYEAVQRGAAPLALCLLERGARPDVIVKRLGKSPLHLASKKTNIEIFELVLKFCLKEEININQQDTKTGKTPLIFLVEKLCQHPNNLKAKSCLYQFLGETKENLLVDVQDNNGDSALSLAINAKNAEVAQALLDAGASVNEVNFYEGKTMLEMLKARLPKLVFPDMDTTAGPEDSRNKVWHLIEQNNEALFHEIVFGTMLPKGDFWNEGNGKMTFLQFACQEMQVSVARDLITLGADPNGTLPEEKCPPIFIAARQKSVELLEMFMSMPLCNFQDLCYKGVSIFNILHCILDPDMIPCTNMDLTLACLKAVLNNERCNQDVRARLLGLRRLPVGGTPLDMASSHHSQVVNAFLSSMKPSPVSQEPPTMSLKTKSMFEVHRDSPITHSDTIRDRSNIPMIKTITGQSPLPKALELFKSFLRSTDGILDDDDEDEVSQLEMELEFLVRTNNIDGLTGLQLEDIGRDFFSLKYKMSLDNRIQRAMLEQNLKHVDSEMIPMVKAHLREARQEKYMKLSLLHEKWISELRSSGVLKDRSGDTYFTGAMAKDCKVS